MKAWRPLGFALLALLLMFAHADAAAPDRDVTEVDAVDRYGYTALHWAAFRGDFEEVERLLAAGADPELRSTAPYSNRDTYDPREFASELYELPAGMRPYDLADAMYRRYRWSAGSKYLMARDRLDKVTRRRSWWRR